MNHEVMFIKTFIKKELKKRYLELLKTEKGRRKLLNRFYHLDDIDTKYLNPIEKNKQTSVDILRKLKDRKAGKECYIISADSLVDKKYYSLDEAINKIVGNIPGTIVSCIPGQLAYYEGEDKGFRIIFEKV